jgi:ABC-type transport system, involved in lipoprotein release, permease component
VGSVVLVLRLALADARRHRTQAAMLLLAVTVATATMAIGLSLHGVSDALYAQTRAATAGPDVVVLSGESGPEVSAALASLTDRADVVAHHGPYRIVYADLTTRDSVSSPVVVHGFAETPNAVNRPLVTAGRWVRPGGTVLERGFAVALGVDVGDRVTIAGRSYPVVGIAVTAATSIYPWGAQIGPYGGPSDYTGLAWMTRSDARALAASRRLPVTTAIDLRLRDPAAAETFRHTVADDHPVRVVRSTFRSWQFTAHHDKVILRNAQPIMVIGGWLLGFLAVSGVATLAAGRVAEQTRRAGLLKAVGAGPGLIAAVLLTEYLGAALAGDALGLTIARLAMPAVAAPTASRIGDAEPTVTAVIAATVLAVAVAVLSTLGPTLRAMRTATVPALAASAHQPRRRPRLNALSALLPTPLLLGLRLTARRPGRAVLQACSTATTVVAITALLAVHAQRERGYGLDGSTALPNLRGLHDRRLMIAITVLLIALAIVNILTFTWTTAMEARATMAIVRTLGATPGQVAAGLSAAQLLPSLPGAVLGVPLGFLMYLSFRVGNTIPPRLSWMAGVALATLVVTAALTVLPARLAARRSVAATLSAETA